jgi:hypothetical protein
VPRPVPLKLAARRGRTRLRAPDGGSGTQGAAVNGVCVISWRRHRMRMAQRGRHQASPRPVRGRSARLMPWPVPHRPAARRRVAAHRHMPGRAACRPHATFAPLTRGRGQWGLWPLTPPVLPSGCMG